MRVNCISITCAARKLAPKCVASQRAALLSRQFHATVSRRTDGVFRALTDTRMQTPWIEALRKKQAEDVDPTKASGKPEVPAERDLTPKPMSASYHSVVSGIYHCRDLSLTRSEVDRSYHSPKIHGYSTRISILPDT